MIVPVHSDGKIRLKPVIDKLRSSATPEDCYMEVYIEGLIGGGENIPESKYQALADRIAALENKPAATVDLNTYAKKSDIGGTIIRIISGRDPDLQHNRTGWQIPDWEPGDQVFFIRDGQDHGNYFTELPPGEVMGGSGLSMEVTAGGKLKTYGRGGGHLGMITFFHIRGGVKYSLRNQRGGFTSS